MDNISLILTVLNEERSMYEFLNSVARQSIPPDEVVIVDAGSTDRTLAVVQDFAQTNPSLTIVTKIVPGNRSVGRNAAIRLATHDLIAATDAGCILDPVWLQKLIEPFTKTPAADFVGGWYQPRVRSAWDASLAAVLGFEATRVDTSSFLPSTRSMAFRKSLWTTVGGFNERNSHSEDTPFSSEMRAACSQFVFVPDAIVRWTLVQSYRALYRTIARYALGDGEQRLWMFQYRLLSFGVLAEIALIVAGIVFDPWYWYAGAACLIGYLYLPFATTRHPRHTKSWYQIPLMKATLIAANLAGFYRGLLRPSTVPERPGHNAARP